MALLGIENLKRNIKIFLIVVFLAFLFWYSFSLQEIFYNIVQYLENYSTDEHKILGMLVFVGLGILGAMFLPFSVAPVIPAAVIIWGNFTTFILLAFGWLTGAVITYYIGYWAGHFLFKDFIPFERVEYYRQKLTKKAEFWLVLMFRLAMPAEIPGYTLGIIHYNFWLYFLATAMSEVPFALISVYASEAFLAKKASIFIALIGFIIILMSIMFYLFHRYLMQRKQEN